jgi:hypothetical protein
MKKHIYFISVLAALITVSCQKKQASGSDVYPDPPPPLVEFLPNNPVPNTALGAGETVKIAIEGLSGKQFTAYVSSVAAEVVETTNEYMVIKVPQDAITGSVSVNVNGQLYFGPTVAIRGSVAVDPNFDVDNYKADLGYISGILARDAGTYIIYGNFQKYQSRDANASLPARSIAVINANGADASTTSTDRFTIQIDKLTSIYHMTKLSSGSYLIAGSFASYGGKPVNGLVRVNSLGWLDTTVVEVVNPDPVNNPDDGTEVVSALNGGVGGTIQRVFVTADDKYIAAGVFDYHISTYYPMSQKNAPYLDVIKTPSITKMFNTGLVDSSFNYDFTAKQGSGVNGFVYDAAKLPNDDVILVGDFSGFQGQPAGYIVRVNATNGKTSSAFNAGTGADGPIMRITSNPNVPDRYVLCGFFKHYNGVLVNGVAIINGAGNLITSFQAQEFSGGLVYYAGLLQNGNVVVSGTFTNYGTKVRPGLAILNSSGALIDKYNKFGLFRGRVMDMLETTSNGLPALFLVGSLDRYDNQVIGNIVKLNFTD